MEKVERLIRTWIATQEEAQIMEAVAGEHTTSPDLSLIQAKIVKRYLAAKSHC